MKSKIALIVDIRKWAFDNIAKNIEKFLSSKFDFKIFYIEDFKNYTDLIKEIFLINNFDIIHFFWRLELLNIITKIEEIENNEKKIILSKLINKKITTTIYDHAYLDIKKNHFFYYINNLLITELYDAFSVSSKKLFDIYKNKINNEKKKIFYTPDGVDLNIFNKKSNKNILKKDVITLGWIGNSQWKEIKNEDVKGLYSIIIPAWKKISKIYKKKKVILKIIDRSKQKKILTKEEVSNWLNEIDIYLNASLNEGTPNPVLEAMACGIPVISTDVGIINEVFGKRQKKLIFERNIEDLIQKTIFLIENPKIYKEISEENLNSIKKFDISKKIKNFETFFEYTTNKKTNFYKKAINLSFFLIKLKELKFKIFLNKIKLKFNLFNRINIGVLLSKDNFF
jgi:glycosyltransferase involved in cell wall biosynthesis